MSLAESLPIAIGQRYTLLAPLGRGGMGSVYRTLDRLTGQTVALKRILTDEERLSMSTPGSESVDLRLVLAHEFELLSSLHHPGIINVLDYGFDAERLPYFTMELVPDAQTILEAGLDQPLDIRIDLLVQMLLALIYLHHRGIIHRDLKPGNVLVSHGQVRVLDFGLSVGKQQTTGTSGTLAYMAPEILAGAPANITSDLYAVGMMMYELFTGAHPYTKENMSKLLDEIIRQPIDVSVLSLDPELKAILARLLDREPSNRFQSAVEVIQALAAATERTLPIETQATRESFLQATRFIGRKHELSTLKDVLQKTLNGQGNAYLIGGESGVGKTRLLDELRTQALVRGVMVLHGQAVDEGGAPYQVWSDALRWLVIATYIFPVEMSALKPVVTDIERLVEGKVDDAPALEPKAAQARLFTTIAELAMRHREPLVVILEDLHWADSESLALLAWLTRLMTSFKDMTGKLPMLILASYRNDERQDLPQLLPDMNLIQLERLSSENIALLSESMLGEVGREKKILSLLERETEGNAFFLVEVVRALAESAGQIQQIATMTLPDNVFAGGIQRIVKRRLERLNESDLLLLKLAAVAGRILDLELLRTVDLISDLDGWLIRGANAAVLSVQERRWQFAHDKIREVLLNDLSQEEVQRLHRMVAITLEAIKPNIADYAATLAHHWAVLGDLVKEAHYTKLAGEQAAARFATSEAIRYLSRAMELTTDLDTSSTISLKLATIFEVTGQWDEAQVLYQTIISRYDVEHTIRVQAEQGLGRLLYEQGHFREAVELLKDVLAKFERQDNLRGIGETKWLLATDLLQRGEYIGALTLYQEALTIARSLNDQQLIGNTLGYIGFVYLDQGVNDKALNYLEQWYAIASRIGDKMGMRRAKSNMVLIYNAENLYLKSMQYSLETLNLVVELGDKRFIGKTFWGMGDQYAAFGDWQRAKVCYSQHLHYMLIVGDRRDVAVALGKIANVLFEQGYYDDAEFISEKALILCRVLDIPYFTYEYLYNEAHLFSRQKRYDEALERNRESLELIKQVNGRKNIQIRALLLDIWLRVALNQTSIADAVVELRQMLDHWSSEMERAMINYTIWQIDPSQEQHRQRAAELISTLYTLTPTYELRQRYTELTGAALSPLPVLPELPEIALKNPVDLDTLLLEVNTLIESINRG